MSLCPERRRLCDAHAFYARYGHPGIPVVFVDGTADWPAQRLWTFDWFRKRHGNVIVSVDSGRYRQGPRPGTSRRVGTVTDIALAQYIDELLAGKPAGYLAGGDMFVALPSLKADLLFPRYARLRALTDFSFWMGAAGTTTQLHFDRAHNLYGQLVGRKRFQLFAPAASQSLFPAANDWSHSYSELDLGCLDGARLAKASSMKPDYDFELGPGELLFLPYGWWHRVITLEPSIAANLWWWTVRTVLARGPGVLRDVASETLANWAFERR